MTPDERAQKIMDDHVQQTMGRPGVKLAIKQTIQAAQDEALERARLAYEAHIHSSIDADGDACSVCGQDIRNPIHLRVNETREGRIRKLKGVDDARN